MGRHLSTIQPFKSDDLTITAQPPSTVKMQGVMAMRSPSQALAPHLRAIHAAALADQVPELTVDVTQLAHVNSASIFLFLDWARWIASEPAGKRYVLHFFTRSDVSWHELTLPTMQRICAGFVKVTASTASA